MAEICDYKNCKREGASVSIIIDEEGEDHHVMLCKHHIEKMIER